MTSPQARAHYSAGAQLIHWLTAAAVLMTFIISSGGPESRVYSPDRAGQLLAHESLGVAVFVLAILSLAWRLVDRAPASPPMMAWMRTSSRVVQAVLSILLVVTPASAVLGAWLSGHPLTLAAIGPVGPFFPAARGLGRTVAEVHSWLGDALIWLAGLHAAAALLHHFVLKDRVLVAMLPGRARER